MNKELNTKMIKTLINLTNIALENLNLENIEDTKNILIAIKELLHNF